MQGQQQAIASMSNFIDWTLTSGPPRMTLVTQHKRHGAITDFYRPLRERLVASVGLPPAEDGLDDYLGAVADDRAARIFPSIVAGWRRFTGAGVPLVRFDAPRFEWPVGPGVCVDVNPELAVRIDGTPHLLKLYLRGDPLAQRRVDMTVALLDLIRTGGPDPVLRAVLDVRNGKIRYRGKGAEKATERQRIERLLRAEGAGYATAYASV